MISASPQDLSKRRRQQSEPGTSGLHSEPLGLAPWETRAARRSSPRADVCQTRNYPRCGTEGRPDALRVAGSRGLTGDPLGLGPGDLSGENSAETTVTACRTVMAVLGCQSSSTWRWSFVERDLRALVARCGLTQTPLLAGERVGAGVDARPGQAVDLDA